MPGTRFPVAVLGATGAVGQRFVELLASHPWFEIALLVASDRSRGRPYGEAARWRVPAPLPQQVAAMPLQDATPREGIAVAFSALDAEIAEQIEPAWARAGIPVFSNARSYRMAEDVPLLVPEVNPDHLELVAGQSRARGYPPSGFIVTNPNCSATVLALGLAPLHRAFGIRRVSVVTLQAISGAGYGGLPSMDILGNVIPFIAGEEQKIESETCKILGELEQGRVHPAEIAVSAQVNRVPVMDGHTQSVAVELRRRATLEEIRAAMGGFGGEPQALGLPTAPPSPLRVLDQPDRPQPALDLYRENAMTVLVGGIRPCSVLGWKMTLLGHNTIRGAAGASILNAELARVRGLFDRCA